MQKSGWRFLQTVPNNVDSVLNQLNGYESYINHKISSVDYVNWISRQRLLQTELNSEVVWSNSNEYARINTLLSQVAKNVKKVDDLKTEITEAIELYKMSISDNDEAAIRDCHNLIAQLDEKMKTLQLLDVMSDPLDVSSCYIQIIAGAGGTEACDWSLMLCDMYKNWSAMHEYSITVMDEQRDAESGGGFRNVTLLCEGKFCSNFDRYVT